jgi:soluble lytic murein transglycosylase
MDPLNIVSLLHLGPKPRHNERMTTRRKMPPPHREQARQLSSTVARRLATASLLAMSVAAAAAGLGGAQDVLQSAPSPAALPPQAGAPVVAAPVPADPLMLAVYEWRRLRASDALPFGDYARFLLAHPGWPGEAALRRVAERRLDPSMDAADQAAAFFARFPPQGPAAEAKYAEVLAARGRMDEAMAAARRAWTGGYADELGEVRLLARFGQGFTAEDHDKRIETLLWRRSGAAAARQIGWASPARRPVLEARLAFQQRSVDAQLKAAALAVGAERDAGLLLDRAFWLRDTGRSLEARALAASAGIVGSPPADPERWLDGLLVFARAAVADQQWTTVEQIARGADLAFPFASAVRDQPLAIRDDYTSLAWLGGTAALTGGRPTESRLMFERYAAAARSPQTQSKGYYWAARAARAGGEMAEANRLFALAAQFSDQFYGQLAAERLGQPLLRPASGPLATVTETERAAFERSELVRVARMLGRQGLWTDQSLFLRVLAQRAESSVDHQLNHDLAREIGRPDLGVMTARAARQDGGSDYVASGFPQVAVPASAQASWTMVHAISRQESQFDREATSRVGARGMMQLMPATAREQAGKLGLDYDYARLADPSYNLLLGAGYFSRMLDYYGGSYVLAVAAYNAGPGNVNRMIQANGDPRMPGSDVVRWIEQIPLTETRGYVQRVLENAVVYDLLNPARATMPAQNRLSAYLGKPSQPG